MDLFKFPSSPDSIFPVLFNTIPMYIHEILCPCYIFIPSHNSFGTQSCVPTKDWLQTDLLTGAALEDGRSICRISKHFL